MNVVKKDVGFRAITLKYDGEGKLNDFEIELIKRYEDLHREALNISKDIDVFIEKSEAIKEHYNESSKWVKAADIMIEKAIRTGTMEQKEEGIHIQISDIYVPSAQAFTQNIVDYNKLSEANNKFAIELNEQQTIISKGAEEMMKNFRVFEKDYFKDETLEKVDEFDYPAFRADVNDFILCLNKQADQWKELQLEFKNYVEEIFNPYARHVGSFSERLQKMNEEAIERSKQVNDPKVIRVKNYELPANSEQMTKYATMLDEAGVRGNGIYLEMSWAAIDRNDTSAIMDIIRVAQHKTDALRNIIYGIQFKINDIPLSEPMGSRQNIFMSPKILAWFAHLGEIPMIYFFIRDPGTGSHCLFADMILDGSLEVIQKPDEGATYYGFQPPNINIIFNRLFEGAVHFLEFCYGTGVDARPHVDYAIQCFREGFQLDTMFPRPTTFKYEDVEVEWKRMYRR